MGGLLSAYEVAVEQCARCGNKHPVVRLREFQHGPAKVPAGEITHWGFCPETCEPILATATPEPERVDPVDPFPSIPDGLPPPPLPWESDERA